MGSYTREEYTEALRAINSVIHKCEKAQEKFPEGNSHHTLLRNRLKAMYLSKALITEALAGEAQADQPTEETNGPASALLLGNLDKLHTTDLGAERIKRNLSLKAEDAVAWCRKKIEEPFSNIARKGKNWYIVASDSIITVNAYSYTIITAHKKDLTEEKGPFL